MNEKKVKSLLNFKRGRYFDREKNVKRDLDF